MIYLDYNATHPPISEIFERNWKRYQENPANPSGISAASQKNQSFIDKKRKSMADALNLPSASVRFASTGTEATYWLVRSFASRGGKRCILSSCEHDAMIAACRDVGLKIDFLPLDKSGLTKPTDLENLLSQADVQPEDFAFVSVIHASNETGVIQPVEELSEIARSYGIPFLSDTIQSAGKLTIPVKALDGFLINGHKLGAGAGGSATVVAPEFQESIVPLYRGGLQEDETRAGTENLMAIGCLSDAFLLQQTEMESKHERLGKLHAELEEFLARRGVVIAGQNSPRLSNTTYAIFSSIEHMDFLLMGLDQAGVVCSTGSSCKSRTRQPSRVLRSMGYSEKESMQALRFSSGLSSSEEDLQALMSALEPILKRLMPEASAAG